jgi:1-acyl-sn-glycerol-3-phosphate acyltransferase
MSVGETLLLLAALWFLVVLLAHAVIRPALRRGPRGDAVTGLLWRLARVYCRLWHRARYVNDGLLPAGDDDHDGLIVVANHTGSIDPLLLQARARFWIRWMMGEDMMSPRLAWLWANQQMIRVNRYESDPGALRQAIRHVRGGGCVGLFPEGRIPQPPGEIRPFLPGVGLLVAATRKPVLLVWVSGTPRTNRMMKALTTPSRARVEFIEMLRFDHGEDHETITRTLRRRIADVSGWPFNDVVQPPGGANDDATAP